MSLTIGGQGSTSVRPGSSCINRIFHRLWISPSGYCQGHEAKEIAAARRGPSSAARTHEDAFRCWARVADHQPTETLLRGLIGIIKQFCGLPDNDALLLGHAVLASWLIEFTEVPVCVGLIGPPSPERRQPLRLLRCLFRRALVVGEASLGELCSLPMDSAPTLAGRAL